MESLRIEVQEMPWRETCDVAFPRMSHTIRKRVLMGVIDPLGARSLQRIVGATLREDLQ